jgi:N-acylneuraminate cytidylyltransferase
MKARSQDLPDVYCPTGAIWVAGVEHLRAQQTFRSPDSVFWPMPWEASIDIDTREDLHMAELLYTITKSGA